MPRGWPNTVHLNFLQTQLAESAECHYTGCCIPSHCALSLLRRSSSLCPKMLVSLRCSLALAAQGLLELLRKTLPEIWHGDDLSGVRLAVKLFLDTTSAVQVESACMARAYVETDHLRDAIRERCL